MKYIVNKHTIPGNRDVGAARPCILLPKHGTFIGCKVVLGCLTKTMPQLIFTYARRGLRSKSGIYPDEEVINCSNLYVKVMKETKMQKRLNKWEFTGGYLPMHTFLPNILYNLSRSLGEQKLFELGRDVKANK